MQDAGAKIGELAAKKVGQLVADKNMGSGCKQKRGRPIVKVGHCSLLGWYVCMYIHIYIHILHICWAGSYNSPYLILLQSAELKTNFRIDYLCVTDTIPYLTLTELILYRICSAFREMVIMRMKKRIN